MPIRYELYTVTTILIDYLFLPGAIMFCAFAVFGSMPLLGYVIIPTIFPDLSSEKLFTAACVVTGLVLFLLGSLKSNFA